MSELLRIQPQVPRLDPGQFRVPPGPGAYIGKGLEDFGSTIEKVQDGAARAEAVRSITEGGEEFQGIVQNHVDTINDPDELVKQGSAAIKEAHQRRLESASPRARPYIEAHLSAKVMDANNKLGHGRKLRLMDNAKADYLAAKDLLIQSAVGANGENRKGVMRMFGGLVGGMVSTNYMKREAAAGEGIDFEKKVQEKSASAEIEITPELFLRKLGAGEYEKIDVDKRLSLRRTANAAITSATTIQNREQKAKTEQAEREIQKMFDNGTSGDVINARLKVLSAAGLLDRNDRKFWDEKLIKGEVKDSPAQIDNALKLKDKFLDVYPTPARVNEYRERKRAMQRNGEIGDKGASEIGNMLIMAERSLNSEARANRAEGRAIENKDKPKKMTSPQAVQLLGRNFPNANPNRPVMPAHKEDLKQFTERVTLGGEEAGDVAKEIFTAREKKITEERARKKQQADTAAADPKAASILNRLKELPK